MCSLFVFIIVGTCRELRGVRRMCGAKLRDRKRSVELMALVGLDADIVTLR